VTGLIMLQPDLGTTLIVAIIGFGQIFISNINMMILNFIIMMMF
jgi:cell division protein FtsW (lipid II flippase)